MIDQEIVSDAPDLDADDVDPHVLIDIPVYGLPTEIPATDRVRLMVAGINRGILVNDAETILAVLFDANALRLNGWKIELVVPIEIQAVRDGEVR